MFKREQLPNNFSVSFSSVSTQITIYEKYIEKFYFSADYTFLADAISSNGQAALDGTAHLVAGALAFVAGETFEVENCVVTLTETL